MHTDWRGMYMTMCADLDVRVAAHHVQAVGEDNVVLEGGEEEGRHLVVHVLFVLSLQGGWDREGWGWVECRIIVRERNGGVGTVVCHSFVPITIQSPVPSHHQPKHIRTNIPWV